MSDQQSSSESKRTEGQKFMDLVFEKIAHGDEQHRAWLFTKCAELSVILDSSLVAEVERGNACIDAQHTLYVQTAEERNALRAEVERLRAENESLRNEKLNIAAELEHAKWKCAHYHGIY